MSPIIILIYAFYSCKSKVISDLAMTPMTFSGSLAALAKVLLRFYTARVIDSAPSDFYMTMNRWSYTPISSSLLLSTMKFRRPTETVRDTTLITVATVEQSFIGVFVSVAFLVGSLCIFVYHIFLFGFYDRRYMWIISPPSPMD